MITMEEFDAVDIRVGEIISAEPNTKARNPAFVLTIDFGPGLGTRTSSAQLTVHYTPETLRGRRILAVVNFPPRRVAGVKSEVLVLGVPDEDGAVVLVAPDRDSPLGGRLF
ncbi:MAG: tRNA-binding protein [Gemmatimonadales bacterium]